MKIIPSLELQNMLKLLYVFISDFIVCVKNCPPHVQTVARIASLLKQSFCKVHTLSVTSFLVSCVVNTATAPELTAVSHMLLPTSQKYCI